MNTTEFSIVMITRNRGDDIRYALNSIKAVRYPADRFELIVVDNGSTDNTAEVVRRTLGDAPFNWNQESEGIKGICRARNRGARAAGRKWIMYIDDDAIIPSGWLSAYADAIAAYPGAAVFGGPAVLSPSIVRPWWWCSKFDLTMSCQDYGRELITYPEGAHPYGLNMVIRRDVLMRAGGFDTVLDDVLSSFADETELFIRLMKQGDQLVYVPGASVIHAVSQDRFNWKTYMSRCRLVGRSHAYLDCRHGMRFRRSLPRRMASAMIEFCRFQTPAVFFQELSAWSGYRGYLRESAGSGA